MSYLRDLFAIIIFISITITHVTSLIQTNLFFGHVCQKSSPRVLIRFCLIFCQFQCGVSYKSVAYKKKRAQNKWDIARILFLVVLIKILVPEL